MDRLETLLGKANTRPISDARVRKILATYSPLKDRPISDEAKRLLDEHGLYLGRHRLDHDETLDAAKVIELYL
jgi:hypothetical protein